MTRGRASALCALIVLPGCGKKAPHHDPACTEEADHYEPSATEVPLPGDYRETAEKRVGPDNYQRELARIARELGSIEREKRPSDEDLRGTEAHP